MYRPIDLDKLISRFEEKDKELKSHFGITIAEILQMENIIEYLRTDAEKEAQLDSQSEWVLYNVDTPGHPYHCRKCGWSEQTGGYRIKFYDYCPNCGRKMKVEMEEKII